MRDFISPHNVPFYWKDRLEEETGYTLYVSDCFWVLATKEFYEFYYNPIHAMGKIHVSQMPQIVKERIKFCSAILHKEDIKFERTKATLMKSPVGFYKIERDMRIGNWFHAQGQNYATWKGYFICDDMYMPNLERSCPIKCIDGAIVFDLIRMGCQSRTPHYIKSVFDLNVFNGVRTTEIELLEIID